MQTSGVADTIEIGTKSKENSLMRILDKVQLRREDTILYNRFDSHSHFAGATPDLQLHN